MKVAAEYLIRMGACSDDVDSFKVLFPDGFRPTLKNCVTVVEEGLDYLWFVESCMTARAGGYFYRRYKKADQRYSEEALYMSEEREKDRARALFETFKHYGAKGLLKRMVV